MASCCLKEGAHEKNCEEVPHHQNLSEGDEGTPRLGLIFSTYEDVRKFYILYAQRIGFGIMKRSSAYREDGTCDTFVLACDKQGKPNCTSKNPYLMRPSAKTNCKAKIIARLKEDGLYHLSQVHLHHNHVISPSKLRFHHFKRLHALASTTAVVDNSLERSETIQMHCQELADIALEFGDKYDMALKLIVELKETLSKESITFRSSQENQNHATTLGGVGNVACGVRLEIDQIEEKKNISKKIFDPNPLRRKGRLPSKKKQSIVEKVCTQRRKKVSQRKNKTSDGKNLEKHDIPTGTQMNIDLIANTNFIDVSVIST